MTANQVLWGFLFFSKHTEEVKYWNFNPACETRQENKKNRLKETDAIKPLVDYAKEQESAHSDKLYFTYTKLAKRLSVENVTIWPQAR